MRIVVRCLSVLVLLLAARAAPAEQKVEIRADPSGGNIVGVACRETNPATVWPQCSPIASSQAAAPSRPRRWLPQDTFCRHRVRTTNLV